MTHPLRSMLLMAAWAAALAACASTPDAPGAADTFRTHCAACHGMQGAGDGPAAAAFRVTVPDLRALSRRNGGVFPADAVASRIDGRSQPAAHGAAAMPVWGSIFDTTARLVVDAESAQTRIDGLVAYLRDLQLD